MTKLATANTEPVTSTHKTSKSGEEKDYTTLNTFFVYNVYSVKLEKWFFIFNAPVPLHDSKAHPESQVSDPQYLGLWISFP